MARIYKPGGLGISFEIDRIVEHETTTCAHCQHITVVPHGVRAEDTVARLCRSCMRLICPVCVRVGICRPIEKWLEQQEKADRTGRYNTVEFDKAYLREWVEEPDK